MPVKEIEQTLRKLEKLEVQSKDFQLPEDWFWNQKSKEMLAHVLQELSADLSLLQNDDIQRPVRNINEALASAVDKIKEHLKLLSKDVQGDWIVKERAEINHHLRFIHSALVQLLRQLNILDKHYADDPYLTKKKHLLELHFPLTRYPFVTQLLLENWKIVEEIEQAVEKSGEKIIYLEYLWSGLPLIRHFVEPLLPQAEVQRLRLELVGKKSPEQIYRNPEFIGDFREFLHTVAGARQQQYQQAGENLHDALMLMIWVIRTSTIGEHLGRSIMQEALPTLMGFIQSSKELKWAYSLFRMVSEEGRIPLYITEAAYSLKDVLNEGVLFEEMMKDLARAFQAVSPENRRSIVFYFSSMNTLLTSSSPRISWYQAVDGLVKIIQSGVRLKYVVECVEAFTPFLGRAREGRIIGGYITWEECLEATIYYCKHTRHDITGISNIKKACGTNLNVWLTKTNTLMNFVKGIVEIQQQSLSNANTIINDGLLQLQPYVGEKITWQQAVEGLSHLGKELLTDVLSLSLLLESGLKNIMIYLVSPTPAPNRISWEEGIDGLLKIAAAARKYSNLPRLSPFTAFSSMALLCFNGALSWKQVVEDTPKLTLLGKAASALLSIISEMITPLNWPMVLRFLEEVAQSRQKTRELLFVMQDAKSDIATFLLYLIETRPGQVLDIFSKYHLLITMQLEYQKQVDMILMLARPIVLVKESLDKLQLILTLLEQLPSRQQGAFLRVLDRGLFVFQRVQVSFLTSLQQTEGFGDISANKLPYSFVELAYLYFLFASEPGISGKKLQKKVDKVRKDCSKAFRLVSGKKKLSQLNEMQQKQLQSALESVAATFFEPALKLVMETIHDQIEEKLRRDFQVSNISQVEEKTAAASFQNALMLYQRLLTDRNTALTKLCYTLIQYYLQGQTFPLHKNIWSSYPWNLPENQAWLKGHMKTKWWVKDFVKSYNLQGDSPESNRADRIDHHLRDAKKILQKLNINLGQYTLKSIEEKYLELKNKGNADQILLADLKTQIDTLRQLQQDSPASGFSKVKIGPELDPLEILQMGNYVAGSCLNINGSNYWSAIVNASDVNKRVLWAKDESGNIVARILIAVDESNRIVRFPVYYATDRKLDQYFNDYILELAKKCRWGINGDNTKVKNIFGTRWYTDGTVLIDALTYEKGTW